MVPTPLWIGQVVVPRDREGMVGHAYRTEDEWVGGALLPSQDSLKDILDTSGR